MKKTILLFLFICFTLNAQQQDNKKKKELIIKNNIKEILTYKYNEKGDSIKSIHDIYDKTGNHVESLLFRNNRLDFRFLIKYNEKNLKTKMIGYNENGEISTILLFEYDDNGNKIEKSVNENGEILSQQKIIYNKENKKTEILQFNRIKTGFFLSSKIKYNDNNKYSFIESYDSRGQLTSQFEYIYNDGNLSKVIDKVNKQKIRFKYNSKNLLIEKRNSGIRNTSLNGIKFAIKKGVIKFLYDKDNNLISTITSSSTPEFKNYKYFYEKHE